MQYKSNTISCQSNVGLIITLYAHTSLVNPIINHITAQTMWQTELILHTCHDMKTVGNPEYI